MYVRRYTLLSVSLFGLLLFAGCSDEASPSGDPADSLGTAPGSEVQAIEEVGGPPLGRYVCRQHLTTMGYLTLKEGGVYDVSGVEGRYRYDANTGAMVWEGGSYDEWNWEGVYEHVTRPEDDGRPDEAIIRLTSEADGLKIDCYKMEGE